MGMRERLYALAHKPSWRLFMDENILALAQAFVDVITWFLLPFAFMLVITWALSFFRR